MAVTWKKLAYASDVIANSLLANKGGMIYASAAGTPAQLAIGTNGYILQVSTDVPAWVNPTTLAVANHASTHKNSGADEILLNEFGEPTGNVALNGYQLTDQIIQTVANEAAVTGYATPVVGKILWSTAELAAYLCTSAA